MARIGLSYTEKEQEQAHEHRRMMSEHHNAREKRQMHQYQDGITGELVPINYYKLDGGRNVCKIY